MQKNFSDLKYAAKKKLIRFLAEIKSVTPWVQLIAAVESAYPKGDGPGRLPIGLPRKLRMYVVQHDPYGL